MAAIKVPTLHQPWATLIALLGMPTPRAVRIKCAYEMQRAAAVQEADR